MLAVALSRSQCGVPPTVCAHTVSFGRLRLAKRRDRRNHLGTTQPATQISGVGIMFIA